MQNSRKTLIFTLILSLTALSSSGQITIDQSNFIRSSNFIDTIYSTNQSAITLPSEGASQSWDYSSLNREDSLFIIHIDASGDPNFPGALNYYEANLDFQGFFIQSNTFEDVDANGWYDVGRATTDVTYSIQPLTGGANDSLRFTGGGIAYSGRIDFLQFPVTYQDQWTDSYTEIFNFEITVVGFGLNQVPGYRQRVRTDEREIVAYGDLKIPMRDGSSSGSIEVLLLKAHISAMDSFFLGGNPAPASLLAAFGLTQGIVARDSFYVFYASDFGAPVLNLNISGGQVSSAHYRPTASKVATYINEIKAGEVNLYPNPVSAGQTVVIKPVNKHISGSEIKLMDIQGRIVQSKEIKRSASEIRYSIPKNVSAGHYILEIIDEEGNLQERGKLEVF